jgi:hypothetical protein
MPRTEQDLRKSIRWHTRWFWITLPLVVLAPLFTLGVGVVVVATADLPFWQTAAASLVGLAFFLWVSSMMLWAVGAHLSDRQHLREELTRMTA